MDCCADYVFPTSERKIPLWKSKGCVLQNSFCDALNIPCYLPKCKYFLPVKGNLPIPNFSGYKPDLCQAFFECRNKLKTDMNPLSRFMQQSYILKQLIENQ